MYQHHITRLIVYVCADNSRNDQNSDTLYS